MTTPAAAAGEKAGEKAPEPAAAPAPSITRLAGNASIYGIGQVVMSVIGWITGPVLSYLLTVADFGLLGVVRSIGGMLAASYRLGMDGTAARFYFDVEGDPAAQRRVIGTLNTIVLAWALGLSVVQEVAGPAIYARALDGVPYSPYGRLAAYGLLCGALCAIPQALLAAQEQARRVVGLKLLGSLLGTALALHLLVVFEMGAFGVLLADVLAPTLLLVPYLRFTYGTFGLAWDRGVLRRGLAFGLPMVVHLTSHWALDAADRLMLDRYLGREAVGLYTAAYGSTTALLMINLSLNSAYVPQFTRAHGKPEQREFVGRAVTYLLAWSGAASAAFVVLAPTAIRLFYADGFRASADLSPILCLAPFFQAVYLIYVNALFHAKAAARIPVFTVLAGAVNVGLNAMWIPRFGVAGAAWATLAGYAALALLFALAAHGVHPIPFERRRLASVLGPAAAAAAVGWALDGRFPLGVEVALKLSTLAGGVALLFATGFVGREERAWIAARRRAIVAKVGRTGHE